MSQRPSKKDCQEYPLFVGIPDCFPIPKILISCPDLPEIPEQIVGPQGPAGPCGTAGIQGPIGLYGSIGPAGPIGPRGNTWAIIGFNTETAPYTSYNSTIFTTVADIYYDTTTMQLRKISAVVSRTSSSASPAYISFRRADTLAEIAQLTFTRDDLHVIETTSFQNLPNFPVIIEVVVRVDNAATDLRLHNISFLF